MQGSTCVWEEWLVLQTWYDRNFVWPMLLQCYSLCFFHQHHTKSLQFMCDIHRTLWPIWYLYTCMKYLVLKLCRVSSINRDNTSIYMKLSHYWYTSFQLWPKCFLWALPQPQESHQYIWGCMMSRVRMVSRKDSIWHVTHSIHTTYMYIPDIAPLHMSTTVLL